MHFSLKFLPSDKIKLIISVSKKVDKKAVVRNRIKRRVRAVFRNLSNLKAGTYMIIARADSQNIKGEELQDEINKLIAKSQKL